MKRLAFSDDMMRALAAGAKTMTRRPIRNVSAGYGGEVIPDWDAVKRRLREGDLVAATCAFNNGTNSAFGEWKAYRFQFSDRDLPMFDPKWKPARIMPAALAPFVLRITSVRAEHLGEITEEDAEREAMLYWVSGCQLGEHTGAREVFALYWDRLYGRAAWMRDRDSWVWVYGFEIAERRCH